MAKLPVLLKNTFLSNTKKNFEKALILGEYHFDALTAHASDAFFATMLAFFGPLFITYRNFFIKSDATEGMKQGDTKKVKKMLEELSSTHIKRWDTIIEAALINDVFTYEGLFSNGRKPFQTGRQENKIKAVAALLKAIGDNAKLAAIKEEIAKWHEEISAAQGSKEGKKSTTKTNSTELEMARIALCEGMWKDLMDCNSRNYKNPELSVPYFNWEVLRPGDQENFSITIEAMKSKQLAKRTLANNQQLKVVNNTNVSAEIGCTNKGGTIATKITILPKTEVIITTAQIGNSKDTPLIMVVNPNEEAGTHLMIEIVKVKK